MNGKLQKDWISGNESEYLYRQSLLKVPADIFIPAGGRPRTINLDNFTDFLDEDQQPTAQGIVEAANLYISPNARLELEQLGALIIKDSSANKGGVICSSLEVIAGLMLSEEEFLEHKSRILEEMLNFIQEKTSAEVDLLLRCHKETKQGLSGLSDLLSERINTYTDQILNYLKNQDITEDHPLCHYIFEYLPPIFSVTYKDRVLERIPPMHKKAIIACHIASSTVYNKGLNWAPSIVDLLPK